MYSFGSRSTNKLNTCHRDLQMILNSAIKIYDFSVIEGIRSAERQLMLYKDGKSKLDGINNRSKHQGRADNQGFIVSYAVDIVPYKKGEDPFKNTEDNWRRYYFLMGVIMATAEHLYSKGLITHKIRLGLDWQMDFVYHHKSEFFDAPHIELV